MKKSVFILETPTRCVGCPFCGNEYTGEGMNIECVASYCCLNAYEIENIESKPDWCPLMDLPEKDSGDYPSNTFDAGYAEGWNTCIDEIAGEL